MTSSSFITVNWPQLGCYSSAALCAYYSAKQTVRSFKNCFYIFIGADSFNQRVTKVMDSNLPLYHKSKNLLVGDETFKARFNYFGKALLNASFGVLSGIAAYILFDMGSQMSTAKIKEPPTAEDQAARLKEKQQLEEIAKKMNELKNLKAVFSHLSIRQNRYFPSSNTLKQQFGQKFDQILAHYFNVWTNQLPNEIQEMLALNSNSSNPPPRISQDKNDVLIREAISKQDSPLSEKNPSSIAEQAEKTNSPLQLDQFKAFLESLEVLVENDEKYRQQDLLDHEEKLSTSLGPVIVRMHEVCKYLEDSFKNPTKHAHSWLTSSLSPLCKPYLEAKEQSSASGMVGEFEALMDISPINENNQNIATQILKDALNDRNLQVQEYLAQIRDLLDKASSKELKNLRHSNPEVCSIRPGIPACQDNPRT